MSSSPPEPATIDAWLAGDLPEPETEQLEQWFDRHPEVLSALAEAENEAAGGTTRLTDLPDRSRNDPALSTLIDHVSSGLHHRSPPPDPDAWREVLQPSDDPALLGTLDHYDVLEVVAVGGMGIVLKARDPQLDRIAALKVLSPDLASQTTARTRFLREARAAAKPEHDHILPIYGVYDAPVPWFAMRYAEGGTLQEKIEAGVSFPAETLKSLARQIASALVSAHAEGIIHRDIKPANILFDEQGEQLWVCDFGIARCVDDPGLTYANVVAGTPKFMSPEQARGEEIDERSDLFSLGAVLYFAATGTPPFQGDTTVSVMKSLTDHKTIRVEAETPKWYRRLIESLLAADPDDRPQTAADVISTIESEIALVSPRQKRNRRNFVLTTAGLAGAAAAGMVGFSRWKKSSTRELAFAPPVDPGTPPRITIQETGETFSSLEAAMRKATDGATVILEGRIECDAEVKGPAGASLHLRAGEKGAEIVGTQNRHALFLMGSATFENIRFVRESWSNGLRPILGVAPLGGGTAHLRRCHFESLYSVYPGFSGVALALTSCSEAEIVECSFNQPGGTSFWIISDGTTDSTRLVCRDSLFLTRIFHHRLNLKGPTSDHLEIQNCIIASELLSNDDYRHDFSSALEIVADESVIDCRDGILYEPRINPKQVEEKLIWSSRECVLRPETPFLVTNSAPGDIGLPVEEYLTVLGPTAELLASESKWTQLQSESDSFFPPFDWSDWESIRPELRAMRAKANPRLKAALPEVFRLLR